MSEPGSPPRVPPEEGKTTPPLERSRMRFDRPASATGDDAIPSTCDRYEVAGLLGEGGMGRVFRAWDPVLKRPVALKVLHAGGSGLVARFVAEARAQARVSHPNVAKVFDVGVDGDAPFIAMQLIEGRSLDVAARDLTPEQVAELMRQVAEGVEAANALGLVHRDLKPTNILVESRPDGGLHPFVVDFGLARDLAVDGMTVAGETLGSPSYMAPEQACADTGEIGSRTDVYGLGATLYDALAGRPPFAGASVLEVMRRVVDEEPVPLRNLVPAVPTDLATIVAKCMEKSPSRRYPNAAAVAADLGRFLAGEPIEAHPVSLAYRLLLRARRNRLVVAVTLAALLALGLLGGYHLRERLRLAKRAELAREFGQVVEKLESELRQAYLLPAHDIRPAKRRVEERVRMIEKRMTELGDVARSPGAYAIGRALLALGRPEQAIARLEEAWSAGYRPEEAAFALAVAYALRYQEELAGLTTLRHPSLREARRKDAQRQFRDPAVKWLSQVRRTDPAQRFYAAALLAFLEKRPDEAVRLARGAFGASEGFYEAKLLEAVVEADRGAEQSASGEFAAARASLDLAEDSARLAARIGESDPAAYEALCSIRSTKMTVALYSSADDLERVQGEAIAACEEAIAVNPESGKALRRLGGTYRLAADARLRKALDPGDDLEKAVSVSRRAVEVDPDDPGGLTLLGTVWQTRGRREASSGGDPRRSFEEGTRILSRAAAKYPGRETIFNSLGVTWWYLAQWEIGHGLDPRPSLENAVRSLRRATELLPGYAFAWVNLGGALNDQGSYEVSRGLDPDTTLRAAAAAFGKALTLGSTMADAWNNSGVTWLYAADHARLVGRDPRPEAARALEAFDRATALSETLLAAKFNRGQVLRIESAWRAGQGLDPEPGLTEARRTLEDLARIETFRSEALVELGLVHIVAARRDLAAGRTPILELKMARKNLAAALAADTKLAAGHRGLAEASLVEARWLVAAGLSPAAPLEAARQQIESGAALDPGHVELRLLREQLRSLEGAGPGGAPRP